MAGSSPSSTTPPAGRVNLVRRRHEVARRWAHAASHGRDDSYSHLEELCRLERLIEDAWPAYYKRYREDWVHRDAAELHSEGFKAERCPYCRKTFLAAVA
jgi:hypothetical protein